jgi:AcrR family transcriptional regulator
VVDAFIDLVLEHGSAPTPETVAERAGVSRATFFRYFSTLDDLRRQAAVRVVERFPDLLDIPDIGAGGLEDRVQRFVDARFGLHETLHSLELVSRQHATSNAETAELVDAVRQVFADQARQHFSTELDGYGAAHGDDVVTAISVLTSVESWQQFRHSHGRTPVQTRRAWRHALLRVLSAPQVAVSRPPSHHR